MATKKFDSVIEALNQINENTSETKTLIKDLIKQDDLQERQRKRDEIASDKADKKRSPILQNLGSGSAALAKKGSDGFLGSMGSIFGMAALVTALPALIDGLNAIPSVIEKVNQSITTLFNIPLLKKLLDRPKPPTVPTPNIPTVPTADPSPTTPKKPDLDPRNNNYLDQEAQSRANQAQARKAKLEAEFKKKNPGLDPKNIEFDQKMGRFRDTSTKSLVKTQVGIDATRLSQIDDLSKPPKPAPLPPKPVPSTMKVPSMDITPPKKPVVSDPRIGNYNAQAGKSKVGSILGKADKAASMIPGYGLTKGAVKLGARALPVVGLGIDMYQGYHDEELKEAGYGAADRMGIKVAENLTDIADFGVNMGTGIAGLFNGKGFKEGFMGNDIDMSRRLKEGAMSETGKYLLSFGRMGENPLAGIGAGAKSIMQNNIRNQQKYGAEQTVMAQSIGRSSSLNGLSSVAAMPEANPALEMKSERNRLYDEIVKATNPEKRDELIEKLTELVESLAVQGEGGIGSMLLQNVTNNSVSTTPLRIDTPDP